MRINLIYPEERTVSSIMILIWADDAFYNGYTSRKPDDLQDAIYLLEDAGLITTKKQE